ncbi:MAG TPA: hypothetical protein VMF29_01740 [Candidatus Edwardsbacteria bacterium]|nr:hypothetical protein [Candidatus Edwardsbacteria bacterium]
MLLAAAAAVPGCAKQPKGPPTPRQLVARAKFAYDIRGKYAGTAKVGSMTSSGPDTALYAVSLEVDSACRLVSVSWHDVHSRWTDRIITWTYPADVERYDKELVVGQEPAVTQGEATLRRIGRQLICTTTTPRNEVARFSLECAYPDTAHEYFRPQSGELRYDSAAGLLVDTVWAAFPPLAALAVPREKLSLTVNGWAIDTHIKTEYIHNSGKYAGQTVDLRTLPHHDYTVAVPLTTLRATMTDVTLLVTDPGAGLALPQGRIDYAADTRLSVTMDQQLWTGVVVFQRDGGAYFKALDRGHAFPLQKIQ